MFGFGGGFNGPGGNSSNSGSAPSGGAGGKAAEKGGRVGGVSSDPRGMDTRGGGSTPSANTSGSRSSDKGGGSMERGRSIDRAGVTGYAGNSKTHEQDIAERHAERQDHVERSLAAGGRMSTNVEGMTAYDESARRARQIGGVVDQTNTALRSNDLMSPFSLESTWDTRYRPNVQEPVASARQYEITPNALAAGGAKPIDSTADLGRYRTVDAFAYGPSTFTDIKNGLAVETANKDAAPGLSAANFASQYLGASAKGGRVTGVAEKGDRVGGSMHGMAAPDPTRFGGALSTPTGDRVTRGFGAAMGAPTAEIDRAAQARAAERTSMDTYDAAARTREDNAKRADMAQAVRADENGSMGKYSAAAALSEGNALRADTASSIRAAENTSMKDLGALKQSYRDAIAHIETRGVEDPYSALGKWTKGDRAYGKYQVMGANIPSWTKQALGYSMTKEAFLADPAAQDATFDHIFGGYVAKHGFENAAQAWFGGEDSIGKVDRTDINGMSIGTYGKTFDREQQASYEKGKTANDFASTYLGKDQKTAQQDYFGSVPDHNWPGNTAPGIGRVGQVQTASAEQGDTAPEDATPKNASIAGGDKPKAAEGDFPDRPRSNFEKFAAAGLDIGAGLIPGVGLGVGLVNGALSLTGNRTIGDRIVDAVVTGDGKYTPGAPGDPNRPTVVADATTIPQKTVPTVESFADSYLNPPDKTKYPTPYERYDVNRNTYAGV